MSIFIDNTSNDSLTYSTDSVDSSTIIQNTCINIHNHSNTIPFQMLKSDEHFGILTIKMAKTKITNQPLFLLFTIDITGSMQSTDQHNCTKLDYVKQTFTNMVYYLSQQDATIYIRVHSFNTDVYVTVENTLITPENVKEISQKIKDLSAYGSTDIGIALSKANTEMLQYIEINPTHQAAHICMTDGEPTSGLTNAKELSHIVNETFYNIFVGFGLEHNAVLLRKLSEKRYAEYQFIDNMENTALVYGETIHRFLYPALRNVDICMEDGLIYDWKINKWTNQIEEAIIVSEIEKIYHIKTTEPNNVQAHIYGVVCNLSMDEMNEYKLIDTAIPIPELLDFEGNLHEPADLTKYAFRQKTQELLFIARKLEQYSYEKRKGFKIELKTIFRKMRRYMRLNNLMEDPFMKLLCDDISVTYKTMDTQHGTMFAMARHSSQGRQQTYNTSSSHSTDDNDFSKSIHKPNSNQHKNVTFQNYSNIKIPTLKRLNSSIGIGKPLGFTMPSSDTDNCIIDPPQFITRVPSIDLEDDDADYESFINSLKNIQNSPISPLSCSPSSIPKELLYNHFMNEESDDDELYISDDELDVYKQTGNNTTCYSTPGLLRTMRSMSKGDTPNKKSDDFMFEPLSP